MYNNKITLHDIKYDLLKIIEPYDGFLEPKKPLPVRHLFTQYLSDLYEKSSIYDFSVETNERDFAFTFDVSIRLTYNHSPKQLKIHVGTTNQFIRKTHKEKE